MQETDFRDRVVRDEVLPQERQDLLAKVSLAIDRLKEREIRRIVIYLREGETQVDTVDY